MNDKVRDILFYAIGLLCLSAILYAIITKPPEKEKAKPAIDIKNTGKMVNVESNNMMYVVEIDGCEYLKSTGANGTYTYTHKGNCKNHKSNNAGVKQQ